MGLALLRHYLVICLEGMGRTPNTAVKNTGVPIQIWTEDPRIRTRSISFTLSRSVDVCSICGYLPDNQRRHIRGIGFIHSITQLSTNPVRCVNMWVIFDIHAFILHLKPLSTYWNKYDTINLFLYFKSILYSHYIEN
jgi:hypothetical protein